MWIIKFPAIVILKILLEELYGNDLKFYSSELNIIEILNILNCYT